MKRSRWGGRGQGTSGPAVIGRIPPRGADDAARRDAFDDVAAHVQALGLLRPLQTVAVVGSAAEEVADGLSDALVRAGLRVGSGGDYTIVTDVDGADAVIAAHGDGQDERPPAAATGVVLTDVEQAQAEPDRRVSAAESALAAFTEQASPPREQTDDREAGLEERIAAVTARERELARRVAEVAQREREVEEREGRQQPATDTDERERQLEARVAAVTERERTLIRRVAELGERERELERRRVSIEGLARTAVAQSQAARVAAPVAAADANGPTMAELERLVADNAAAHPDRVEDWNAYLFFLREHADAHGRLSGNFLPLVDDVFGDLLARRPA